MFPGYSSRTGTISENGLNVMLIRSGYYQKHVSHGFRSVGPDEVPKRKWIDYDPERRARLHCLRLDL